MSFVAELFVAMYGMVQYLPLNAAYFGRQTDRQTECHGQTIQPELVPFCNFVHLNTKRSVYLFFPPPSIMYLY